MPLDYYEILQVSPNADVEVIQAAYKRLALKYHPDRNHEADAHEKMRQLNEAYETLSNPDRRNAYDAQRRSAEKAQPPRQENKQAATAPGEAQAAKAHAGSTHSEKPWWQQMSLDEIAARFQDAGRPLEFPYDRNRFEPDEEPEAESVPHSALASRTLARVLQFAIAFCVLLMPLAWIRPAIVFVSLIGLVLFGGWWVVFRLNSRWHREVRGRRRAVDAAWDDLGELEDEWEETVHHYRRQQSELIAAVGTLVHEVRSQLASQQAISPGMKADVDKLYALLNNLERLRPACRAKLNQLIPRLRASLAAVRQAEADLNALGLRNRARRNWIPTEGNGSGGGDALAQDARFSGEHARQVQHIIRLCTTSFVLLIIAVLAWVVYSAMPERSSALGWVTFGLFVAGLAPLMLVFEGAKAACPQCRLWWARVLRDRRLMNRETFDRNKWIERTDKHYDKHGNYIGKSETGETVRVTVARESYRHWYACKYCHHTWESTSVEEHEID